MSQQRDSQAITRIIHPFIFRAVPFRLLTLLLRAGNNLPWKWVKKVSSNILCSFTGGENFDTACQVVKRLHSYNIDTILDYYPPFQPARWCNRIYLEELNRIVSYPNYPDGLKYLVIKLHKIIRGNELTICHPELLYRLPQKNDGIGNIFSAISMMIANAAHNGLKIIINTGQPQEYPFITNHAMALMEIFNLDKPVVHCSVPVNKPEIVQFIRNTLDDARKKEYIPGFVLIRGGYHPWFQQCSNREMTRSFEEAVSFCIEHSAKLSVIVASHRESIIGHLRACMKKFSIVKSNPQVQTAQVTGVADDITLELAQEGFRTLKYLPYGLPAPLLKGLLHRADINRYIRRNILNAVLRVKPPLADNH